MKDVSWKTYGTSFGFVMGVVNDRLCSLVPLDSGPGLWKVSRVLPFSGWNLPDNTWTGRHFSPGWFLSLLDIRRLFSGWGKATLSTRETLQEEEARRARGVSGRR